MVEVVLGAEVRVSAGTVKGPGESEMVSELVPEQGVSQFEP